MARSSLINLKTPILQKVILPSRIDITSFGTFEGGRTFSKDSLLHAIILDVHPTVSEDIEEVRKNDLHLDSVLPYPEPAKRTFENVISILFLLDNEKRKKLREISVALVEKYKLPSYWKTSLEIKIATDVIPVPADWGPVYFHSPYNRKANNRAVPNLKTLGESVFSDPNLVASMRLQDNIEYPGIFIRERMRSKNTLIAWIDNNWDSILKPTMDKLPRSLFKNVDLERFAIGIYVWKLKKEENWDYVDEEVTKLEASNPDFFGPESSRIIPDRTYLQKVVSETEEYLQRFLNF